MKQLLQNKLVQLTLVLMSVVVFACILLAALVLFAESRQSVSSVIPTPKPANNNACYNTIVLWMEDINDVQKLQYSSVKEWQAYNVDIAIEYYDQATQKYFSISAPLCDKDANELHDIKAEELLYLGKSYREALLGNDNLANQYASSANLSLKKQQRILEIIRNKYNLN